MMVQVDISTCTIAGRVIQPASMFAFCYGVQHNITIKTLRRGEYPVALRGLRKTYQGVGLSGNAPFGPSPLTKKGKSHKS